MAGNSLTELIYIIIFRVSFYAKTVHIMKQTPLNNAQAALGEETEIEKMKKCPLKLCVII